MSPTTKLCMLCEGIIHAAGQVDLGAGLPGMWLLICDDCDPGERAPQELAPALAGNTQLQDAQ